MQSAIGTTKMRRRAETVTTEANARIAKVLDQAQGRVKLGLSRAELIEEAVNNREAVVSASGALATWTPVDSTGRSPKDTMVVKRPESEENIDWDAPNNRPLSPETFEMLLEDALKAFSTKSKIYVSDRVVGADPSYALPIRTVSDRSLSVLFSDNMFRPVTPEGDKSIFHGKGFTVLALPTDKLDPKRYEGRLRIDPRLGHTSTMAIAMDMDQRIGIVFGSRYCGSVKKLVFTVMNYLLPLHGILSLHCSANEGPEGDIALLLGLSGTGKTTLSADPRRALLGDDEHGWNENGVANYENGCYAKLIDLSSVKEPEIFDACFHKDDYQKHGAIIENAMMYPDGTFDLFDPRFTPNSRGSYPLSFLANVKEPPVGDHPKTILFLTADANGVLPPVSKLGRAETMLWFILGYTSKLAGTETGVVDPVSTFSRFFGAPFMPLKPDMYASMLGKKLDEHGTKVYLINTGWSGGPYGVGKRMDIDLTRALVNAALSGDLGKVKYEEDILFHLQVPKSCPGIEDAKILNPRTTWPDPKEYDRRAQKLAKEFSDHFDKSYGNKGLAKEIVNACPGKGENRKGTGVKSTTVAQML